MNYAKIISLKKNEIKYVVRIKKKSYYNYFLCLMTFIFVIMLTSIDFRNIINNPVNSLYNDNSDVVFTSGDVLSDKLSFSIPVVSGEVEVLADGTVNFKVSNLIMVKSIENGIVEGVGKSNDGVKYVRIRHNDEFVSFISNIEMIGVSEGDVVAKGKDIATSKIGDIVSLRLYRNDMQVNKISVLGSKVLWQD